MAVVAILAQPRRAEADRGGTASNTLLCTSPRRGPRRSRHPRAGRSGSGRWTAGRKSPCRPTARAEQGRHVSLAPGAVDPESRWLAAGSVYRAAQIWDMASGRRINWLDDVDFVSALQFSADGRRLLTGTENGTVSIWELGPRSRDGSLGIVRVSTFKTEGPVRSLSVDPSGLNLVVHGGSTVSVWRIGQEAVTIAERDGARRRAHRRRPVVDAVGQRRERSPTRTVESC